MIRRARNFTSLPRRALLVAGLCLPGCGGSEFGAAHDAVHQTGGGGSTGTGGATGSAGGGGTAATGGSGSGGAPDAGSTGGASAGGGTPGTGGATGAAGGTGDASPGCTTPTTWYPDNDQDQHGDPDGAVIACSAPSSGHWVTVGDDCDDSNNLVYPGAPDYHDQSYTPPGGVESYDYDCSGTETAAPGQASAAPACSALTLCTGEGFVPLNRSGTGVNSLCGSHTYSKCVAGTLSCTASITTVTTGYKCR